MEKEKEWNMVGNIVSLWVVVDIPWIKEKCILELNPQSTEYLTIRNTVGIRDKGILIGDYKIGKRKNQPLKKEGMMEVPLFEEDSQKQAF